MTDLNTTPPSWATEKDIAHPAWKPFLAYMRDLVEYPTSKLWTIWHAAWLQSGNAEMKKQALQDRIRNSNQAKRDCYDCAANGHYGCRCGMVPNG